MSHNFPYRRLPAQTDTPPPDYGPRRAGAGGSGAPSSSEPAYAAQGSDLAVGLLQSYGLGASDLARLAQLPEEMLNLDSLPHLLRQLRESRETTSAGLPSLATAAPPPSSRRPAESRPLCAPPPPAVKDQWAQIRDQPVQYPLEHILSAAKSHSLEQLPSGWSDHRAGPRPEKPLPPPPSSSSSYPLDYGRQERTADQGAQGRDDWGERPARGQQASGPIPPPRSSRSDSAGHYSPGLTMPAHRAWPWAERQRDSLPHSRAGAVQPGAAPASPSRKEALDFHGSPPGAFPYSCSLCNVMALSSKVWLQHINGSHHADQQLALLQRYPSWDCRTGRRSRFNDQPAEPKDNERPAHGPLTTNHNSGLRRNKGIAKKTGNSKVVCAKFEAHCVDEVGLRTLMEPFGKIVKVILFPCLAFVELGSSDQAKDLEKYYSSNPAAVQGKEVTFEISSTFNFLQSSRVLSFTPAPVGDEGFSDLLKVVRRFGAPLYVLALPSQAFIEMKLEAEAKKLVDYYSSNSLQLNGEVIKVGFSAEYNTLTRVSSAKKYEEQEEGGCEERGAGGGVSSSTKRYRSPGTRGGRSQGEDGGLPKKSKEETEKRSRSRERLAGSQQSSSGLPSCCEEAGADAATPQTQCQPAVSDLHTTGPGPADSLAESSEEESDIEGMAVIGEDGQSLDEEEEEEEEEEEREREESSVEVNIKKEQEEEREEEQTSEAEQQVEKQNIMEFLENCITLDELEGEEEEEEERRKEKEEEQPNDGDKQEESESTKTSGSEATQSSREPKNQPSSKGSVLDPSLPPGQEVLSDLGADTSEEEPRRSSPHSTEKEVLEESPSSPADLIPQPTRTQETSQIGPEEDSPLSRKCLSEEQEVPRQAETPPQEVDGLVDTLSEPGSQDQEEAVEDRMIPGPESNPPLREQNSEAVETRQAAACTEGLVLPAQPTKPIGADFVRPVVGYFCNLCQVIYVDEEEAKTTHCSTLTHYQKYQEHTGQDPWST